MIQTEEMKELAAKLCSHYDKLKAERSIWETHWQEIGDYFFPRKNFVVREQIQGEKKGITLLDSTGAKSNVFLASALSSMLTNASTYFFEFTTGDPVRDAKDENRKWLQEAAVRVHATMNNSNFQTETHEVYLDLPTFGTAPMFVEEDDETVVRFASRPVGQVVVDENSKGIVDTVYRCFKWKPKQIIQEFGKENVPESVIKAHEKNDNNDIEILHSIYPREFYDDEDVRPINFPIASVYMIKGEKFITHMGGYREMPAAIPRWSKTTGEKYGRSPAMDVLPEVKMLNKMQEAVLMGAQKTVNPPLQMPDEGFMKPDLRPGKMNYYRAGSTDRMEPVITNARVDFGFQAVEEQRKSIRQAFYYDQLLLLQGGPQMTATEVIQRRDEMLRLMGPVLSRQHVEFLRPVVSRVFAIMQRKGMIPPVPKGLDKATIDVQYSSMVARAQRSSETENILRTVNALQPFIALFPDAKDNLNPDKAVRYIAKGNGFPQELLRDENEIGDLREERSKLNEQMLAQQQNTATSEMAMNAGSAMEKMARAQAL
jgi:hypothetical protein